MSVATAPELEGLSPAGVRTLAAAFENGGDIDVSTRQTRLVIALIRARAVVIAATRTEGGKRVGWTVRLRDDLGLRMGAAAAEAVATWIERKVTRSRSKEPARTWPPGSKACPSCFCTPSSPCTITLADDCGTASCAPAGLYGWDRCSACQE